ncbi:MAG: heat shock protein HspQ [Magnetococcales bacterium]|nr:heat shock protein HspQ [Magnetococcales bacterium]
MKPRNAKFAVGQIIQHNLFDYRGVIVDVDPVYLKDDAWYERMPRNRPPKDQPWYQILVDAGDGETYVAERNLCLDNSSRPVDNPRMEVYFHSFSDGRYLPKTTLH